MGGESLRPYLKMQNLFCRDINRESSHAVVKATLEKLCPHGKVVVPIDHADQSCHISQAYLNFNSPDEARRVLDKHRFGITFKGQTAKLMYAAIDKDRVYGPYSLKFQIIIKNLSEEVDVQMLFELFSEFGEIYQCKTDIDLFGQYFGQVTYMDEESVAAAVEGANQTRWHSSVIVVEPHHKAHLASQVSRSSNVPPDASSSHDFPSLGSTSAAPPPPPPPAAAVRAQQQQQQQAQPQSSALQSQEQSMFATPVNFALQASSSSAPTPPPFSAPTLPQSANITSEDSNGPFSAFDIPVAMPVLSSATIGPVGSLGLPGAPGGGAVGSSSSGGRPSLDEVGLKLSVLHVAGGESSSISTPMQGSAGPAADAMPARLGMPGHLLHLLDRYRAEPAAGRGSLSSAGDPTVSRLGVQQNGAAAVGVPTAAVGVKRAGRGKSGVLAGVVQTLEQVSEALCCPITHEVFKDPVVAADGVTYERAAILDWLSKNNTSPMTNVVLPNLHLHPNNLVKTLVEELL